ncbi:MAG: hypothetical protein A3E80_05970 [Chlamydiae bacterium RIFCSPHIGHO2_12_FULL_49_9]|nr:MAG: hypothetical protein A3E80_05970 [Chlamydiae bacterium RIFCSPHIGHO2_12_FULL_49_9]
MSLNITQIVDNGPLIEHEEREKALNPTFRLRGQSVCFFREYNLLKGDGTNLFDLILKYKPRFKNSEQVIITVDLRHLSPLCTSEKVLKVFLAPRSPLNIQKASGLLANELNALRDLADYTSHKSAIKTAQKQFTHEEKYPSLERVAPPRQRPPVRAFRHPN